MCLNELNKTVLTVMGCRANDLPNDILILIFQILRNDYTSLLQCTLVNYAFNCAASRFLYRWVVLTPRFRLFLSLRQTSVVPVGDAPLYSSQKNF